MGDEYIRRIMVLGEVPSLGPVMLFDDMEDLLKWTKGGTGGDSVLEKSTTVAFNKLASLHIKTRATNPVIGDEEYGYRRVYQRPGKRYRLECLFRFVSKTLVDSVTFEARIFDGTLLHGIGVKFYPPEEKWAYRTGLATYTDFPGGGQDLHPDSWHRCSVEFDQASKKITRFVCDNLELSGLSLSYYTAADPSGLRLALYLSVKTETGAAAEIYVDDLLLMEI